MVALVATASAWVQRWSHLIGAGASVLDVACGGGRHSHWFADRGCRVTAVDRDPDLVTAMAVHAPAVEAFVADLECARWPFHGRSFDAVVVTNYLWRPLLPTLVASVANGGVLLYETFADGQAAFGRPSNPDFLLRDGELLQMCAGLRVVAYECGVLTAPDRSIQRIAAVRDVQCTGARRSITL